MKSSSNVVESVEFLAVDDLLVSELDKRLSFTALGDTNKSCSGFGGGICGCLGYTPPCRTTGASAVRG